MATVQERLLPPHIQAILVTDRTGQALFSWAALTYALAEMAREEGNDHNRILNMGKVGMAVGVLASVHQQGRDQLASSSWWLDEPKQAVGDDSTRIVSSYASGMTEF